MDHLVSKFAAVNNGDPMSQNGPHAKTSSERLVPTYVRSLKVEQLRCFKSAQSINFGYGRSDFSKWTVILGNNGLGKTTILECLAVLFPVETDEGALQIKQTEAEARLVNNSSAKLSAVFLRGGMDWGVSVSGGSNGWTRQATHSCHGESPIIGYAANRSVGEKPAPSCFSLLGEKALLAPTDWLLDADYAAAVNSAIRDQLARRRDAVIYSLLKILPGVSNIEITPPTLNAPRPSVVFETFSGRVPYERLGLGYQSVIAWVVDLASRMHEAYPTSEDPLAEPVVVLVDEIDLHLHPSWQRQIMQYLSDIFPRAQFIVTSHSPLIVLAAPEANLAVLKQVGDEVVILNDVEHVRTWRVDQVLTSDLFGLETARGPDTEKLLAERRTLMTQPTLSASDRKRVGEIDKQLGPLPTAETPDQEKAMRIIRDAAAALSREGRTG